MALLTVSLTQPFLVFQICFPADPSLCAFMEITVFCDDRRTRRRLVLSSSFKDVSVNALHAQLPLGLSAISATSASGASGASLVRRGVWLHLVVDCAALCLDCFQQVRATCSAVLCSFKYILLHWT